MCNGILGCLGTAKATGCLLSPCDVTQPSSVVPPEVWGLRTLEGFRGLGVWG